MARRRAHRRKIARLKAPTFFVLDRFTLEDLRRWTALRDKILRYHWEYYSSLAYQRSRLADRIRGALQQAAQGPFRFQRWQRVVRLKHAVEPLSVAGSLTDPGGRFNLGDIDAARYPPFPALYASSDMQTCLQEALSQDLSGGGKLDALEYALTSNASFANASISGSLESVVDLNHHERLKPFLDLIKDFVIPGHLSQSCRELGWAPPEIIRTLPQLKEALLFPNWREWPMQYDVPVASQIFGQLAADAGIEGIVYPSKFSGKDCLAVFPQNLENDSHVALDDAPPAQTRLRRLDAATWRDLGKHLAEG